MPTPDVPLVRPGALDVATASVPLGDGAVEVAFDPGFDNVGGRPQGGYVMAVLLRAALERTGRASLATATTHYLRPVEPGRSRLDVEVIRSGRRYDVVEVRLSQDDRLRAVLLATLGDLHTAEGTTHEPPMPTFPPLHFVGPAPFRTPINAHYRLDLEDDHHGFLEGRPRELAISHARIRATEDGPLGHLDLPILADWRPPGPFLVGHFGDVPTVELDLHVQAAPPWSSLRAQLVLESLRRGQAVETMRFWDQDGRLVATSRQLLLLLD